MVVAYCWPPSVLAGEPVELHASGEGSNVDVEVVRDSGVATVVWSARGVAIDQLVLAPTVDEDGCGWPSTLTIPTDESWRSGVYLVRLRRTGTSDVDHITAFFVVRAPVPRRRAAPRARHQHMERLQRLRRTQPLHRRHQLSFERPLAPGCSPSRRARRRTTRRRRPRVRRATRETTASATGTAWPGGPARSAGSSRWAEAPASSSTTPPTPTSSTTRICSTAAGCYLSVGHDEYWSGACATQSSASSPRGGNVAFLSGNTCYWQVRIEGDVMVGYKHRYVEDPVYGTDQQHLTTTMWSDPIVGRPETEMTGRVVHPRRLPPHRPQRAAWQRRLRGPPARPLAAGRYRTRAAATCSAAARRRGRLRVRRLRPDVLVDGLPVAPGGRHAADFEVVATAPATPFDRDTTPLPLAPGGEYELEFHAERLFGDDSPANARTVALRSRGPRRVRAGRNRRDRRDDRVGVRPHRSRSRPSDAEHRPVELTRCADPDHRALTWLVARSMHDGERDSLWTGTVSAAWSRRR